MEQARQEFERLEALKYKKKSAQQQRQKTQKSKSKENQGPYSQIKSRLYKSIESSRQKERTKFEIQELEKKAAAGRTQGRSNKENQVGAQAPGSDAFVLSNQKSATKRDHYTPLDTPSKEGR